MRKLEKYGPEKTPYLDTFHAVIIGINTPATIHFPWLWRALTLLFIFATLILCLIYTLQLHLFDFFGSYRSNSPEVFNKKGVLKACVRYFLSNCCFSPNDSPFKNYEKCFLFHLKSSFRSQDIQIFVFSSSPLFFLVSHCFRGWSKKNLKIYDVINNLNKNLVTHFVWYLEKEMRCDIQTLSIDSELNKEHFYGKIMQKMCFKS